MFEVVLAVVAGVITAPGGGVGAAATLARRVPLLSKLLTHLGPKLRAMNSKLGGQLDVLISKLDEMLSAITGARAGSWCFVAGTMIMTAQGAVPIEQIREGDLVWSTHEETGVAGLRPVIELYRNEAEEIWTVRYAGTEDGAPVRELRCTGEHPFWSETERSFVPASELKPGGELRLFGGEAARVVSVTPHRGPPGVKTRVYNFAVAEHHTYYAGEGGVWVHNVCPEGLERLVTRYVSILETGNSSKTEAMGEVFDWMRRDGGFSEEDFQQTAEYLFSKAIDDIAETLLRSNPNSYPTHRELITMRAQSGIEGQFIESHHLLHKKLAQDVMGITDIDDIIAVPLTQKWHRGVRKAGAEPIIGEGADIRGLIYGHLRRNGASITNPTIDELWRAHRDVYTKLGREDWAKAIFTKYFQNRGITY